METFSRTRAEPNVGQHVDDLVRMVEDFDFFCDEYAYIQDKENRVAIRFDRYACQRRIRVAPKAVVNSARPYPQVVSPRFPGGASRLHGVTGTCLTFVTTTRPSLPGRA